MNHSERQRRHADRCYGSGGRSHVTSRDEILRYLTRWRLTEALRRLRQAAPGRFDARSRILVLCAGEGLEGSILCDLGLEHVTVSDISPVGVAAATSRDPRLAGRVLDAERTGLEAGSFDVVLVQDGLHHLQSPAAGFTEMIRVCGLATILLEPHDSWVGRRFGTRWERNDEAVTYVFRWNRRLVDDLASSYLGPDAFENLSFSFWHHNVVLANLGRRMGGGAVALGAVKALKRGLDAAASGMGNQFCGIVLKRAR
jgi:SAM-dependent methyltransferase